MLANYDVFDVDRVTGVPLWSARETDVMNWSVWWLGVLVVLKKAFLVSTST